MQAEKNTVSHSPGPWQRKPSGQPYIVHADDRTWVAWVVDTKKLAREEKRASAALVCAAPELLAAANALLNCYRDSAEPDDTCTLHAAIQPHIPGARDAVAKSVKGDHETRPYAPGPWKLAPVLNGLFHCEIVSRNGLRVGVMPFEDERVAVANSRLIVAAPELLAVCRQWIQWSDAMPTDGPRANEEVVHATERALTKVQRGWVDASDAPVGSPAAVLALAGTLTPEEAEMVLEGARACREAIDVVRSTEQ